MMGNLVGGVTEFLAKEDCPRAHGAAVDLADAERLVTMIEGDIQAHAPSEPGRGVHGWRPAAPAIGETLGRPDLRRPGQYLCDNPGRMNNPKAVRCSLWTAGRGPRHEITPARSRALAKANDHPVNEVLTVSVRAGEHVTETLRVS